MTNNKEINHICRRATIDINQALNYLDDSDVDGFTENIVAVIASLNTMVESVKNA